ncbi:MAG: diguanylate cyclase [Nitrosomonadales bacterium]|nr:diguanylate cyclase [Nitrosomonadales bacterium]
MLKDGVIKAVQNAAALKSRLPDVSLPVFEQMNNLGSRFLKFSRSPVGAAGMMAYIILVANLAMLLAIEGVFKLTLDQNVSGFNWEFLNAMLTAFICIPALNVFVLRPMLEQQAKLRQQYNELCIAAATFESQEGIMITDAERNILKVNRSFTEITGYASEEVVGKKPALLVAGQQDKKFYRRLWATVKLENNWQGEILNRRKNGKIHPMSLTITAVIGEEGQITNYIGIFTDITQQKFAENEIHNLAYYDPLTHLPNRRLLNDRLIMTAATSRRSGRYGAVMFIDLDNFKPLNDAHGHVAGDLLLIEAARRITQCVRAVDTVARFGGDEFVVILGELDICESGSAAQANIVAEKIRASLAEPYFLSLQKKEKTKHITVEHRCTSSIGVTLFAEHQESHETLLKEADMAMYQAKNNGRNQISFLNKELKILASQPHNYSTVH